MPEESKHEEAHEFSVVRDLRQTDDTYSRMTFVADVESNQERSNLLDDPRVFKLASIHGANTRDFYGESANFLASLCIVAANNHVTVHGAFGIEQFGRNVLEC